MTPQQIAASNTELSHQQAIFCWIASHRTPELSLLYHIANEGSGSAARGSRLKAAGVVAGMPDLGLPVPRQGFHGAFFELKRPEFRGRLRGGCSERQIEMILKLQSQGYWVSVVYGWQDAVEAIVRYLELK